MLKPILSILDRSEFLNRYILLGFYLDCDCLFLFHVSVVEVHLNLHVPTLLLRLSFSALPCPDFVDVHRTFSSGN